MSDMTVESRWLDRSLPSDERARLLVAEMTLEERISLLHSNFAVLGTDVRPAGWLGSAAFTPGVARLGLPPIQETDASLGVAYAHGVRGDEAVTAFPSGLALGATFDPGLARQVGAAIGAEARAKGFIVLLAGGANLVREPRGGRSFEYLSEDPLLTGRLAGAAIEGVQSARVLSTVKHFAVNPQETGRVVVSSDISEAALRESDLLAFEIAIEEGAPGAVMTAYNSVNGVQASEQAFLLQRVLKSDWAYEGFAMSDWGGTHSTDAAIMAGLDRQSGEELDPEVFFGAPLMDSVAAGRVPSARVDDAARRIVRALLDVGWLDDPPAAGGTIDCATHAQLAQSVAEAGLVLLTNDGTLPLRPDLRRIAVIGGHADTGVLSGGGSSQVQPPGSLTEPSPAWAQSDSPRVHHPSAPLLALRAAMPSAEVVFDDGADPVAAADLAAAVDVAVVFVEQWMTESADVPDLSLPDGQDALVSAVAARAPRTVVVLETGGPVLMPWIDQVSAVVEAWYPGAHGAEAIAAVLTGTANPSGRLPVSFPRSADQLPRPVMPDPAGTQNHPGRPRFGAFSVDYDVEGSDVGYRWHARTGSPAAFPLGHGLSYTSFAYAGLQVEVDATGLVTVSLEVANTGDRPGTDVPQIYVTLPGRQAPRLAGWGRIRLEPGAAGRVEVALERRVLADWDVTLPGWRNAEGTYRLAVGRDAQSPVLAGAFELGPFRTSGASPAPGR